MAETALTIKDWEKLVAVLQRLAACVGPAGLDQDRAAAVVATHDKVLQRIEALCHIPMPAATWRKMLAKEVSVTVCLCNLLAHMPTVFRHRKQQMCGQHIEEGSVHTQFCAAAERACHAACHAILQQEICCQIWLPD